ncbi:MAG: glycosyltransferase [Gemmataceae bacterium]|nr:glycosyltransferase [Gemmataceae bacterium]
MPLRYLLGPVSRTFGDMHLRGSRDAKQCLTFDDAPGSDLLIRPTNSWDDVVRLLPEGWFPDLLVLHPAYATIPHALWQAPVPKIAVANDWNLSWHAYREQLRNCMAVLSDTQGASRLSQEGIWTRAALLFGCEADFPQEPSADGLRDIDVLIVGNLNPVVQRERAAWIERVASLASRWRVRVASNVPPAAYRRLLQRSRIVFQFSGRRKAGRRVAEAARCGSLVFQESTNVEVPTLLRPQSECVLYDQRNWEELLTYYLEHEDERTAIAASGKKKAAAWSYETLWEAEIAKFEAAWPDFLRLAGIRSHPIAEATLNGRAWQAMVSSRFTDTALAGELQKIDVLSPQFAHASNTLGCLLWRQGWKKNPPAIVAEPAGECYRRAIQADPDFALAWINLAESLDAAGRRAEAVDAAKAALALLRRKPFLDSQSAGSIPLFHPFDTLHVEWEQAAWAHAGDRAQERDAKRALLLWKTHGILGEWTGDAFHHYESVMQRPDLPTGRASLGQALARSGRAENAIVHLEKALEANPFDAESARKCFELHGNVGNVDSRSRLAKRRRSLAEAVVQTVPNEPWFAAPRSSPDDLATIVVVCGRSTHLDVCVERILQLTRQPFELILVAGSALPRKADDWRQRWREGDSIARNAARVAVVRGSDESLPAGIHSGIEHCRGQYVALLHGDIAVTAGWLDSLIALLLHDWPQVGIVAPAIEAINDQDAASVDERASARRKEYSGKWTSGWILGGCMAARREALQRIGPFDPRFQGPAGYADLSIRARELGLRTLIAQDVFAGDLSELNPNENLPNVQEDHERFRQKWGEEAEASLRAALPKPPLADSTEPLLPEGPRRGVTLCMIVKNEEENLPDCLRTTQGLFDEIVIVDTGSADRTKQIALDFGAKVFDFPWIDSFGAARNESLRHATCKWIMWLDADDRLDDDNRERLRRTLAGLGDEQDAYAIQVRSKLDSQGSAFRLLDQVRIFRNLPTIRWDYRIHEQILPAVNRGGGSVRWTDVIVDHVGYVDPAVRRKKLERNLRLLQLDDVERADDSFTLFNLGWTLLDLGRTEEALPKLQRSAETATPDSSILRKVHHLLAVIQRQSAQIDGALKACREGLAKFPDDAELLLEEGLMLRDRGDLAGAEQAWLQLLGPRQAKYFGSEEVGVRGFRTRQLLAEIYVFQKRDIEAEIQWRAALQERPDFEPAALGLGELLIRRDRLDELADVLDELRKTGVSKSRIQWLEAKSLVQKKNYVDAKRLLKDVIENDPQAIGPRVLLSQALIQEGRDWEAAEQALLDVLALDPQHKDARHNLQVLKRQRRPSGLTAGAVP